MDYGSVLQDLKVINAVGFLADVKGVTIDFGVYFFAQKIYEMIRNFLIIIAEINPLEGKNTIARIGFGDDGSVEFVVDADGLAKAGFSIQVYLLQAVVVHSSERITMRIGIVFGSIAIGTKDKTKVFEVQIVSAVLKVESLVILLGAGIPL